MTKTYTVSQTLLSGQLATLQEAELAVTWVAAPRKRGMVRVTLSGELGSFHEAGDAMAEAAGYAEDDGDRRMAGELDWLSEQLRKVK